MYLLGLAGAGELTAQTPYKPQEPRALLGQTEIDLRGPAGFRRVDGLDHDIDEMLAVFLPDSGRELAIFTDPRAWKTFYDEIYGENPSDLAFYATITVGPEESPEVPRIDLEQVKRCFLKVPEVEPTERVQEMDDFTGHFLEAGQAAIAPLELLEQGEDFVSSATHLGLLQPGPGKELTFKGRYSVIQSAILLDDRLVFLNLFRNENGPPPEQVRELARAWRDDYMPKTTPPEPEPESGAVPASPPEPDPESPAESLTGDLGD
jgi:hypothetical protein